jgi:regulator of replication initiation timing
VLLFHIEKDVRLQDISFSSMCMLRCFQGVVFYRGRVTQLEEELEKKERALEASIEEMKALRIQVEELDAKLVKAQADNRMLIDRWMEQKMKDAERLNEVNLCHLFFIT